MRRNKGVLPLIASLALLSACTGTPSQEPAGTSLTSSSFSNETIASESGSSSVETVEESVSSSQSSVIVQRIPKVFTPYFSYTEEEIQVLRGLPHVKKNIDPEQLFEWDRKALKVVSDAKLPPTTAAKLYVTLAIGQQELMTLADYVNGITPLALDNISYALLCAELPKECKKVTAPGADEFARQATLVILRRFQARNEQEKKQLLMPSLPEDTSWNLQELTTPEAGSWLRWTDTTSVIPPPPPLPGSPEQETELQTIRDAMKNVTAEQRSTIEEWNGTQTIAGTWLSITDQILRSQRATAEDAAYVRSTVMMTIMDSLITVWKTKFTYWSLPPSKEDPSIKSPMVSMATPRYPSTQAAVSGAAAVILKSFYPQQTTFLDRLAFDAAQSRLWMGAHTPFDIQQGLNVGSNIAAQVINTKK